MEYEIGVNAGTVYKHLSERGRLSLRKIGELIHRRESSLYLSLGWLMREDKIVVLEIDGEWFFELKN